jgi:gliding motility-associated-like protein
VIFKADDHNTDVPLSDIDNINITVIGPSPKLLTAIPEGKLIRLSWATYSSDYIAGFSIYRMEGASDFQQDSCSAGLPASSGFVKVGYVAGAATTTFVDSDNGQGLQFGKEYAYRIVAVYPNGTESKASNEISSSLVSGVPIIRNVSVTVTDPANGSIFIAWKKLRQQDLDTIPAGPNLEYLIYRANGVTGTEYQLIKSIQTSNLNDTTFTDTNINTQSRGYIYRIELRNNDPARRFLVGEPAYASSVFLTVSPGDRKANFFISRNVPWINTNYEFYRQNTATGTWDLVGSTNQLNFTDPGLVNGQQFCYYVRSVGAYPSIDMPKDLLNLSERICVTPIDNEAPCPPLLNVVSQCDSLYNTLTWTLSDSICSQDIKGYRIYSKMTTEENMTLLIDIPSKSTFTYRHSPGETIAGCYAISAYDANGNEGKKSVIVCIDSCDFYEIPNVFTPNGDDFNEKLVAKTSGLVEKIDFRLFNRNGLLLYTTSNPRIEWDGTYKGKIVSPGVYFYQCDVYERRISGLELFHLSGFVHVITEKGSRLKQEVTK